MATSTVLAGHVDDAAQKGGDYHPVVRARDALGVGAPTSPVSAKLKLPGGAGAALEPEGVP
ncbi:hypothetical protein BE08_23185 [Sorangium cellulosum]|uniref:Uncharacterized protein n=1 Tax=Sorangium cellulosum TaxID=56 RepID=A0A150NYT4_SORCE|nr:hypothetical protein BE08_23185 [Sorangium cellulosum]